MSPETITTIGAVLVALLSLAGVIYGTFANRGKTQADATKATIDAAVMAAKTSTDAAIRLRDEALEEVERLRKRLVNALDEVERAKEAHQEAMLMLNETRAKLEDLERIGVGELRMKLDQAQVRITGLETKVTQLRGEVSAAKMRESKLQGKLNRIKAALDTGRFTKTPEEDKAA